MKMIIAFSAAALMLAGCTAVPDPELRVFDYGPGIEPIRGSLTYGDNANRRSPLPPGHRFTHEFYGKFGDRITERYRVTDDGRLELFSRRVSPIKISG